MTVEHLLLALLDDDETCEILRSTGTEIDELRGELRNYIDATVPKLPDADDIGETQPTLGFQRVLQRAVFHVQSSGQREVNGPNLLVAIFSEQESEAVALLKKQGIDGIDLVSHDTSSLPGSSEHFVTRGSSKTVPTERLIEIERKLDRALNEIQDLSSQVKSLVERLKSKD